MSEKGQVYMNASEFGCGQAHQLAITAAKVGWESSDFTVLTQSEDKCRKVLAFLRGQAEIRLIEYIIDFDSVPFCPLGLTVAPDSDQIASRVRGKRNLNDIKIRFHLDSGQQGSAWVRGYDLKKKLEGQEVYGAQLLDFYLEHPDLIPEDWKTKGTIYFWGTIYHDSDGHLYVRCLIWGGAEWVSLYGRLGSGWGDNNPAAVSASSQS